MDALAKRLVSSAVPAPLLEHIAGVAARVVHVAPDAPAALTLGIAALVHEEGPGRLPALLREAGLDAHAPLVTAIVAGFGEVWKTYDAPGLADYLRRHREHLAPLLLFELAHEGSPTPAMQAAARAGGLADEFETWVRRLGAGAGQGGSG